MRLVALGAALALAGTLPGASAVVTAQAPVTTQPLAPGELLLELSATGSSVNRADLALVTLRVSGEGDTMQAANEAARREAARVAGIARGAAGAGARVDIGQPQPDSSYEAMAALNAIEAIDENMVAMEEGPTRMRAAIGITVRVSDTARVAPVVEALVGAGASVTGNPVYALTDPASARREAQSRALAGARASAEAYAQTLGMRVVRVVRVSERLGLDFFTMMMMGEQRMRRQFEANYSPEVETTVTLGVDFALAPR